MKQVKILKINQANIKKDEIVNLVDENYVKVGTYNFLIKALEAYRKAKFEDDETVTEIIKVMLPNIEEEAKEQWFDGITLDGVKYTAWFATVNGMKQEDKNSKCETLFVSENVEGFKQWFENIISLGKFSKLDKTVDRYVNKEILSRFSLATSDLITEIEMPNIIILPKATIDWKRTYKAVEPKEITYKNDKNEDVDGITYDLKEVDFDGQLDVFDGGGIATPKVLDTIGQTLKRKDIDFAIIRGYGIGMKGLITRFDIIKYLDVMYKADTDFCKKENDKYYLLDMYGEWREVTDNTLLLNESMVKLADKFDNMKDYYAQLNKLNNEEYIDIYNLLNKLYITKVNKKEEELTEYKKLNYQLFNALALTENEYKELTRQDFKLYKKLLKPYSLDAERKEFVENIDTINIFYNQCCKEENDIEDLKEITNVVDKSNVLINLNKENIKLSYVKKNLATIIEKKIRQLAVGKTTIKATYNYIAIDPISYMNFAITREQGDNGLKEGEFYNRKCNDGYIRTMFRNPLMAYSEIHNIKFVRNSFFDNWLCKSSELVYFNQKSDIYSLIGSADSDGDCVNLIDNQIVRNAVIETDKPFLFTADGKKVPCKFDDEGRFLATYRPSGNLIGSVAMLGASVNTESQTLKTYYHFATNKDYTFTEIKNILEEKDKYGINQANGLHEKWDITEDAIKKLIKKGKLDYTSNVSAEIIREKIKQQFYDKEKEIYSLLYCSSLVIDSPKTMNIIDAKNYTREVQSQYEISFVNNKGKKTYMYVKPNFLQYKENKFDVKERQFSLKQNSLLDKFAKRVQEELLDTVEKRRKDFTEQTKLLQKQLENDDYDKDTAEKCWDVLTAMYKEYAEKCNVIEQCKDTTRKQKNKELNKIEAEYTLLANKLMEKADIYSIAIALSKLEKCSERFVISFFIKVLIDVDKLNPSLKNYYIEDENGDIEYMYKTYKKVEKLLHYSDSVAEKLSIKDLVQLKLAKEVRFRSDNVEEIIAKIEEGLEKDGCYDLDITNLEAFEEFKKNLGEEKTIKVKGFMLKKDGTKSISKKSFGIYCDV